MSVFFFWTVTTTQQPTHRWQPTTQRRQHILSHTITFKHMLTPPNTIKHHQTPTPISITDTGPLHSKWHEACTVFLDSCFLHDANMFGQQGMGHDPRTPTLRQVREVCTQREPTERVIIVIVAEREKREKERDTRREKEREETPPSLLPSHTLPSSPSISSKRFRV